MMDLHHGFVTAGWADDYIGISNETAILAQYNGENGRGKILPSFSSTLASQPLAFTSSARLIITMDLTPKQSTPWWALLKCCRHGTATTQEEEEASDMPINDDEPRTPVVKRCTSEYPCEI
jgi:hypothetical protein